MPAAERGRSAPRTARPHARRQRGVASRACRLGGQQLRYSSIVVLCFSALSRVGDSGAYSRLTDYQTARERMPIDKMAPKKALEVKAVEDTGGFIVQEDVEEEFGGGGIGTFNKVRAAALLLLD